MKAFFPAGNKRGDLCFTAGVHVTFFVMAGVNRIDQADQFIRVGENDGHSIFGF